MSARLVTRCLAALVVSIPAAAGAQRADSTSVCGRATPLQLDVGGRRLSNLDTLITLDISDRSWQRDSTSVGVALAAGGNAGTRAAPWRACVGVSALLGHVSANLHNVHGRIRLRVDTSVLDSIGHSSPSPAVPPRR